MSKAELLRARELLSGYLDESKEEVSLVQRFIATYVTPVRIVWVLTVLIVAFLTRNIYVLSGFLLLPLAIDWKRKKILQKKRLRFDADYTTFLTSLASGVRTGLDPIDAMERTALLFEKNSVVREYVTACKAKINAGATEEEAIRTFAEDLGHPDVPLFKTALMIARKEGSSLGASLERLARVTRQRQSFRRKTRAAIAMQKMSAFGMIFCTGIIGAIQYASNPAAFALAVRSPGAVMAMGMGVILVAFGLFSLLHLAKGGVWSKL